MRYVRFALPLLALAFALLAGGHAFAAQGTATLSGKVIQSDGVPVGGATITALSTASESSEVLGTTTTAADGTWSMQVPAGREVWAHFNTFGPWWGYSYNPPFTLAAGASAGGVDFVLAPRAVAEAAPGAAQGPEATPAPGMPSTGISQLGAWIILGVVGLAGLILGMFLRLRRTEN